MGDWIILVAVALAAAALGWRVPRIGARLAAVLGAGWLLCAVLYAAGTADGMMDCHPACSGYEDGLRSTLFLSPFVIVAGLLGATLGRIRQRSHAEHA